MTGVRNHRILVTQRGGPDVLQMVEEVLPEPASGEVRVKVTVAGVSGYDIMLRSHSFPGFTKTITGGKKVIGGVASERSEDLIFLKDLIEASVITTVIDRTYPLEQIADAHAYVDKGHKMGNLVITLRQ